MTILIGIIATAIASVWGYFFHLLKVYDRNKIAFVNVTFLFGFLLGIAYYFLKVEESGQFLFPALEDRLNQAINSFLLTGLLAEGAKLVAVLSVYHLFKKQINQPIEFFVLYTAAALGFSAHENTLYCLNKEYVFVDTVIVLRTFGQVFCIAPMATVLIRKLFLNRKDSGYKMVQMFLFSAFLHGIYDYGLKYAQSIEFAYIFTWFYFFILISLYAIVLTNALNFEVNFSLKTRIGADSNSKKIIKVYLLLFLAQFVVLLFYRKLELAVNNLVDTITFTAVVIFVTFFRLNKLKRIKDRWNGLKLELPFTYYPIDSFNGRRPKYKFKFRGETFNEFLIDGYCGELGSIYPLSKRNSYIMSSQSVFVEKKIFLNNDDAFYVLKLIGADKDECMLIKAKTSGKIFVKRKYPIVALFSISEFEDLKNKNLTALDFQFREWVFVKHR
jgi:RsiW-degrading membrane proteinase PrsW (M82 family)